MTEPAAQDYQKFLETTYHQYNQYVYKLAWQHCNSKVEVEDLVQEVWLRLCTKSRKLASLSKKQQLSYISTTIRNTAILLTRQRKLDLPLDAADYIGYDEVTILNSILDRQLSAQNFRKLWSLVPQPARELLERKYLLYESDAEIALAFSVRATSVRMYLSRARKEALSILSEHKDLLI